MIKCNSCGRECRIGTEQIGMDDRGIPVYHRFAYCDSCRLKYDLDIVSAGQFSHCGNLPERQNIGYAIAGCILSMISLALLFISKRLPFDSIIAILTIPLSIAAFVLCVLGLGDRWGNIAKIGIVIHIITIFAEIFQIPTWLIGVRII